MGPGGFTKDMTAHTCCIFWTEVARNPLRPAAEGKDKQLWHWPKFGFLEEKIHYSPYFLRTISALRWPPPDRPNTTFELAGNDGHTCVEYYLGIPISVTNVFHVSHFKPVVKLVEHCLFHRAILKTPGCRLGTGCISRVAGVRR